ncbi:hypothetical protein SKAU_G00358760 [Synaphobranchus kaupii]|uniref:Major facilitator superfamily (MFS) profile domain-containing protein n=1 Tax=Synaphobranchus kaupii TaxID=118154 RepID=A0A9Q1IFW5_SYNKA|nr:hypothetical protein SKAU_G00358760 [Synaphobranchus kaupii]
MECAPRRLRGMVGVTVTTFGSMGKLFGQLMGLREVLGSEEWWPWLLAFPGLTAAIQLLTLPFFPESPRYLLLDRGDRQGCERAMEWLWGRRSYDSEIQDMLKEHVALRGARSQSVLELALNRAERWQFLTLLATFTSLQLCGINAAAVIENTGKRILFFRGYMSMSAILGLLTVTLNLQGQVTWMPYCSMVLIFTFIFFFSSGPAGITASLPGDIFMQSSKAAAFTIGSSLNWTGLFLIGMLFPLMVENMGPYCFLIFLGFCFFSGVFVWLNVPETKNRTPLEITEEFRKMHTRHQKHELGVSLTVHTMYIMECAPRTLRGMVGVTVTTFSSMGKFFGQLMGLREVLGSEEWWPWLLAFPGLTAAIQLLTLPFFPESPRYLLLDRGDRQGCERAMEWLWGRRSYDSEIQDMLKEHVALRGARSQSVLELALNRAERWQFLTLLVTFISVQLCGINAAAVIENTGKRILFFRGYMSMSAILGLLTVTLNLQGQVTWMPYCSMVLIFTFIFFFSSGPVGITASLPGEIFMQSSKAAAFTIGFSLSWTGLFLIGMLFPLMVENMGPYCFLIFLGFCFFSGVFVWLNVPETKNRTPLEIREEFRKMHTRHQKHEPGVSLTAHTIYLMECAPRRLRGMVGVTVTTFGSMGKFFGQLMGLREVLGSEEWWPWLLAFPGLTAAIQLLTLPFFPESPRYLLLDRGDRQGCERAMEWLWGRRSYDSEIQDMLKEHVALRGARSQSVLELALNRAERWQFLTLLATFTSLQLCGINAAAVIENTGKRILFFRGYMSMSAILGLLTVTLNLQGQVTWMPYCSMVLIFTFIFFFSSGPAGITASLPGDIFMQSSKAAAFTIGSSLNWTGLFLIGMLFPLMVENMGPYCFLIFLGFCFFSGVFVWLNVPETKNRTPLEITEEFRKMHTRHQKHELGIQEHEMTQTVHSTKL